MCLLTTHRQFALFTNILGDHLFNASSAHGWTSFDGIIITYLPDRFNRFCAYLRVMNLLLYFFFCYWTSGYLFELERPGHEAREEGRRRHWIWGSRKEKKRRLYRFDGFARELTEVLCSITNTTYMLSSYLRRNSHRQIGFKCGLSVTLWRTVRSYPSSLFFSFFGYTKFTRQRTLYRMAPFL